MTAQMILFLDKSGVIRAEAPGRNGQRQKIDLSPDPTEFYWAVRSALIEQQATREILDRQAEEAYQKAKSARPSAEVLREQRLAKARADHDREWTEKLAKMTKKEREAAIAKRDAALAKAKADDDERARQVWLMTASDHSVDLANRVIDNPNRRPSRKVIINGKLVSPRTGRATRVASKNRPTNNSGEAFDSM